MNPLSKIAGLPLSKPVENVKPSATLLINERSKTLIEQGKKVYKLGFGQSPFPVPSEVVDALKANAHIKDYLPVRGLYQLRQAVAQHHNKTLGTTYSPEDIIIGPGSKELIYDAQLALDACLLLPSPSWVSYEPQATLIGRQTQWLETKEEDNWCLSPETLEQACQQEPERAKILILNYPNNPTGTTFNPSQLEALAKVARQFNILIIADEIYGLTHHTGKHHSIAQFYPEGTIISTGLSKWCGAGGWRLGTFAIPENYRYLLDTIAIIASETFTSVSAPIQYAAVKAYEGSPAIDRYLEYSRKILGAVGQYTHQRLSQIQIKVAHPEGGFYLFPNFNFYKDQFLQKGIRMNTDFCEKLLEDTGVALLPGSSFGRPAEEFTARLSFVDFDGGNALEALEGRESGTIDQEFIQQFCPQIPVAMDQLEQWLSH